MVLLYFVAGSVLLCIGFAEDVQYDEGRSRHSYPNPKSQQYSLCGRKDESYICDPDAIISESEGLLFGDIKLSLCCT